jgi:phytoene dehydrogenase-like protein
MSGTKQKTVCIIGAGIAGLTAAALLLKNGYKVTVYEEQHVLGGRALSLSGTSLTLQEYKSVLQAYNCYLTHSIPDTKTIFEQNLLKGYVVDLGYHAIGGGVLSNLNEVLKEFDEHVSNLESFVGFIQDDGYSFPFLSKKDKLKILPNILRLLFASEKTLKRLDSVSITETIQRYGRGKMTLILEVFSRSITTVNNLDRISTGEMFRAQRNLYKGSKPVGYPKKGLQAIHEKLADIIKRQGGTIHLQTPVEKILIENGKVHGVQVNGKTYQFDIVVSSMLLQDVFTIADKEQFPGEYVKILQSLTGTGSLCGYYSLKKMPEDLIGKTFHFLERNAGVDGNDAVGMIDFMASDTSSHLSPPGAFLVQSYIICTPDEAKNKELMVSLRKVLDRNLARLIPDYERSLNWALYPAVWHLDGVAKTIDNPKPIITTPIENFYVIGDGVKAMGIGFNCALNSARLLAEKLLTP